MKKVIIGIVALFIIIQIVPYGREHDNPEVMTYPGWDSQKTADLFNAACKDCHSNYTEWPWYSNVAPVSWLVQSDVYEGREHFNINAVNLTAHKVKEAIEEIEHGEMPLWIYLPMHPEADLTDVQKQELIAGLKKTFKLTDDNSGKNKDSEDHEFSDHENQ